MNIAYISKHNNIVFYHIHFSSQVNSYSKVLKTCTIDIFRFTHKLVFPFDRFNDLMGIPLKKLENQHSNKSAVYNPLVINKES